MSGLIFHDKRIVLGVTGSIACYKAVDLASKLTQQGAKVDVILTDSACKFVTPLSFRSITGRKAHSDIWGEVSHIHHVELGEAADLLIVAPATAHTLAKMAHGMADNLLTVTLLAARCPVMVAPAMDGGMYAHPATQDNLETLLSRGVLVIGPGEGRMASGLTGKGRMVEPAELLGHIRYRLSRSGILNGKRIVVTAGPTQEPMDPVRFFTNRSSGKQGIAIAQAALDAGADVDLITGPTYQKIPVGANHIPVRTANDMHDAVLNKAATADALFMAAAVADFKPANIETQKIKKQEISGELSSIPMEKTVDILAAVTELKEKSGHPLLVVGFAAETNDIERYGQEKMVRKGLDYIVINDVSSTDAGFEVDTNRVIMLSSKGQKLTLPLQSKSAIAERLIAEVAKNLI